MYQALYRSFRPENFDTFLGQEHIVRILKNQISTGSTGHAYLFCGTRGTGKTTTARLLAKALNCTSDGQRPCGVCENCKAIAAGTFLDVVEIDAASNNGVDDIRELRESVNFPPVEGRTKVYIIDEAHMLTGAAANALLKTLEEPPENVVFILATTEPNKLPATILSRCMRMDFRRIPEKLLIRQFSEICMKLDVEASPEALALIAANADGSDRDGLSLLDRCISGAKTLNRDDVLFLLGMAGLDSFIRMTDCVCRGDAGEALTELASILAEGRESVQFARDWLEHLRNLIIIKYTKKPENVLNLSIENIERLRKQSCEISVDQLRLWITELSRALADAKFSPRPRILVELAIIRMAAAGDVSAAAQRPVLAERTAALQKPQTATVQKPQAATVQKPQAATVQKPQTAAVQKPQADQKPSAADALAMLRKVSAAEDGLCDVQSEDGSDAFGPDDSRADDGFAGLPSGDAFFPEGLEEIPEEEGGFFTNSSDASMEKTVPASNMATRKETAPAGNMATRKETAPAGNMATRKETAPAGNLAPKQNTAPSPFGKCEDMSEEEKASLSTSFGDETPVLTQDDLDNDLWNEVLHDPSISIQLQMSGAVLRGMNENEFTIMVSNPIIADRFAAHAAHLEDLMAIRSGKRRKLIVVSMES